MSRIPQDLDVERALLGALLLNNDAYQRIAPFLRAEHFYDPLHARVYDICSKRISAGAIADIRTVKTFLPWDVESAEKSAAFLANLVADVPSIVAVENYGRMILELSCRRQLIEIAKDAEAAAVDTPADMPIGKLLEDVEASFNSLREESQIRGESLSLRDAVQSVLDLSGAAYKRGEPAGWPWFMQEAELVLDTRLEQGNLYGLVGASGDGKTSFVLQQLRFGAESDPPVPGLFLSGEQTAVQCVRQMHVQKLSTIPGLGWGATAKSIKDGTLSEAEFDTMYDDAKALAKLPLAIQEWGSLKAGDLGARVRRFVKRWGPGTVIIDHAAAIQPDNPRANLADQIFQIGRSLKAIALDTGCAIILISHRNSDFLDRRVMRPVRSDMYGKENALKNLDACLALFRAERWLKEKLSLEDRASERERLTRLLEGDFSKAIPSERGRADFYSLKTRFGEESRQQKVRFIGRFTRFESLSAEPVEQAPELGLDVGWAA